MGLLVDTCGGGGSGGRGGGFPIWLSFGRCILFCESSLRFVFIRAGVELRGSLFFGFSPVVVARVRCVGVPRGDTCASLSRRSISAFHLRRGIRCREPEPARERYLDKSIGKCGNFSLLRPWWEQLITGRPIHREWPTCWLPKDACTRAFSIFYRDYPTFSAVL